MAKPHARRKVQFESHGSQSASNDAKTVDAQPRSPGTVATSDGIAILNDLPAFLPVQKAEIALLRAFLADEIDAILRSGD